MTSREKNEVFRGNSWSEKNKPKRLEIKPWLSRNPLLEGVSEAFHFGHKVRNLEQRMRSSPPRQNNVLGGRLGFEGFKNLSSAEEFAFESDIDLIQDHEIILGIMEKLAALAPSLGHGLLIFLARNLPREPAAETPRAELRRELLQNPEFSGARFEKLNHPDFALAREHPKRGTKRRSRLPFAVAGESQYQSFLFHHNLP